MRRTPLTATPRRQDVWSTRDRTPPRLVGVMYARAVAPARPGAVARPHQPAASCVAPPSSTRTCCAGLWADAPCTCLSPVPTPPLPPGKRTPHHRINQLKTHLSVPALHCVSKKQDTKLLSITSPNVNRFSKFFHW